MITLSQQRTLRFTKEFIKKNNYAPTVAEIAQGLGIKSRGVVHRNLRALEKAGLIKLTPNRHRNIVLITKQKVADLAKYRLPLIGKIAAGLPIEAIEDADPINLADIFLGENRYALRVKGDSMVDEGIYNDDIVVCQHTNSADNGQIVVALIDQEAATLKRLSRNHQEKTVTLYPANKTLKPITYSASRIEIQGIYIGLFRMAD